jgi:hypothetical protein
MKLSKAYKGNFVSIYMASDPDFGNIPEATLGHALSLDGL